RCALRAGRRGGGAALRLPGAGRRARRSRRNRDRGVLERIARHEPARARRPDPAGPPPGPGRRARRPLRDRPQVIDRLPSADAARAAAGVLGEVGTNAACAAVFADGRVVWPDTTRSLAFGPCEPRRSRSRRSWQTASDRRPAPSTWTIGSGGRT